MVILTAEQSHQLAAAPAPTFAVDPRSRRRYVVLGADAYARLQALFGETSVHDALNSTWDEAYTGEID